MRISFDTKMDDVLFQSMYVNLNKTFTEVLTLITEGDHRIQIAATR